MKAWITNPLLGLHVVGAGLLAMIVAVVIYDVVGRLLFNQPFAGTAELGGAGLVLLTFLQAPHAIRQGKLLRVTYFVDRVPPRAQKALEAVAWAVGALVFLVFFVSGVDPTLESIQRAEFYGNDAFRLPAAPVRLVAWLLWGVAALVCLVLTVQALMASLARQPGAPVSKDQHVH